MFNRIDKNGDGHLTRAEVIIMMRKDKMAHRILRIPRHSVDANKHQFEEVF